MSADTRPYSAPIAGAPKLSIIVPCLNEEENVPDILRDIHRVIAAHSLDVEVILIDDCSVDNTFQVALSKAPEYPALNLRVLRRYHPRRGYGAVLRYGLAHAVGTFVIFVSADGVDPLELIPEFLRRAENGSRLVQCSRYVNKEDSKNLPIKFKVSHFFYRFLVKRLFGKSISDSTYPFRIFRRVELLALGVAQNTFSISPEIFFKLILNGCEVEYIPHSQGMRTKGVSKFRFRQEGIRYGYVLIRAWFHRKGWILWF